MLALGHALVVAISLAIDIVIGVSLGVLVYRRESAANVALAITSTFLAIPSFALFSLFIPIFGLGYTPAVVALIMYGLLPILRNTGAARKALESGEIDMYWEYTGTGWITHLGHTDPIAGRQKQFEAVAKEDLKENYIQWLSPPAPANNTYAIAVRKEVYDKLGVKDLSDFQQLVEENPDEATICVGTEFSTRDDGLPGMEEAYDFEFPSDNIIKIDEGLIYQATNKGDKCNFGEVFATDGRIKGLGLELITDSKRFFPFYNPALCVDKKVLEEYPQIEKVFAPISKKLTTEELQKLNTQVDIDGQLPEDVAQKWLSDNGFI